MDEWKDNQRDRKINEVERVMETKAMGEKYSLPLSCLAVDKGDFKKQKDY